MVIIFTKFFFQYSSPPYEFQSNEGSWYKHKLHTTHIYLRRGIEINRLYRTFFVFCEKGVEFDLEIDLEFDWKKNERKRRREDIDPMGVNYNEMVV